MTNENDKTKISAMAQAEPLLTFFPAPAEDAMRIGAPLKKTSGEPTEVAIVFDLYTHLAKKLVELPRTAERTVALRKLLESRDAALRVVQSIGTEG